MPNQMILFDFIQNRIDISLVVMGEVACNKQKTSKSWFSTVANSAWHFRLKPYRLHFHQSAKAFLFCSSIFVLNISQYISIVGKNINGVQVETAASVKTMKTAVDQAFFFCFFRYSLEFFA
jgi:hypothetical protein